jgi:purine nucleosidase
MGDRGIINPSRTPEERRAVDFILETAKKYPGELEIAVLGPATNIALAILTDRDVMRGVKHIWSMGTPGFGPGNATPVSEFNVFIDAEAYALMLDAGIPTTIIGFDMCEGEIGLDENELAYLDNGGKTGHFLCEATKVLLDFNRQTRGVSMVDLPDAVAMAAALWPDFVKSKVKCYCRCCLESGPTYGQVIFYQDGRTYEAVPEWQEANAEVVAEVDEKIFTQRFMDIITKTKTKTKTEVKN